MALNGSRAFNLRWPLATGNYQLRDVEIDVAFDNLAIFQPMKFTLPQIANAVLRLYSKPVALKSAHVITGVCNPIITLIRARHGDIVTPVKAAKGFQ